MFQNVEVLYNWIKMSYKRKQLYVQVSDGDKDVPHKQEFIGQGQVESQ